MKDKSKINKKIIFIALPLICLLLFSFYLYFPYSEDLVREKIYAYIEENVPDYQNYESNNILDRDSTPEKLRGYAGYMKMYSMTFVHKNNKSLTFEVYTRGFKIKSNYVRVANMLPYLKIAEDIFNEDIARDNVKLIEISTDLTGSFAELNKPSREIIINNSERFIPYIDVTISDEITDWHTYLQELDGKVRGYFSYNSDYKVRFTDGKEKELSRHSIDNNEF